MQTLADIGCRQGCLCTLGAQGTAESVLWSSPPYFMTEGAALADRIGLDTGTLFSYAQKAPVQHWQRREDDAFCCLLMQQMSGDMLFCLYAESAQELDGMQLARLLLHVAGQLRSGSTKEISASFDLLQGMNNRLLNMQRELAMRQQELINNKAMLDAAMKSVGVWAWQYDYRQGRITDSGTLGEELRLPRCIDGLPQAMLDRDMVHPNSVNAFLRLYEQAAQEVTATEDVQLRDPNGKDYVWRRLIYTPVFDAQGRYVQSIGTAIDIAEQKQREQRYEEQMRAGRLLRKNAKLVGVFDLTAGCITDMETPDLFFCSYSAYTPPEELLRILCEQHVQAAEQQNYRQTFSRNALLRSFAGGKRHVALRHYSQTVNCWLESSCDLVKNPYTGAVEAIFLINDVTALVRAEQVVDLLVKLDYECIITIDAETGEPARFAGAQPDVFSVQKACGDFSLGVETYLRDNCVDEEVERVVQQTRLPQLKAALQKDSVFVTSYTLKSGEKRIHKRVMFAYLDASRTTLLCAVQDLTGTYENEERQRERLSAALHAAEAADRAKTAFFSRMSHEMRTPMSGILGLVELAEQENDPARLHQTLHKIRDAGEHMLELINDTLDLQRIESGRLEIKCKPTRLGKVIDRVRDLFVPNAGLHGLCLTVTHEGIDPAQYVMLDALRLNQVLSNILMNAIKFTPAGGRIDCTAAWDGQQNGLPVCRFQVRDTGIGMSQDFVENRLFRIYEQEDSSLTSQYAGSGLGMAITKRLTALMGGTITVESAPGKGSCFTVRLPLELCSSKAAPASPEKPADLPAVYRERLQGRHILLCEDNQVNAEVLRWMLEQTGCVVEHAENGQLGLEHYRAAAPFYYDAVLMDLRMPVLDGLGAAQAIRSSGRADASSLPIVAVTANAYESDRQSVLQAGMNRHIAKPVEPEVLYRTLVQVMEGRDRPQRGEK